MSNLEVKAEPIIEQFCAERVVQNNEPIFGTATEAQTWFLLEYRQPWRAKAVTDNNLPGPVQRFLQELLASVPNSRLLFIKQQRRQQRPLRLFVARTTGPNPALYEFELESYEELLAFDLAAAGDETFAPYQRDRSLVLVCTNGTRDKCCSMFGLPLYQALKEQRDVDVWQATHLGGHRYAPNVLFLPQSVHYGLMTIDEVDTAAAALQAGQIYDLDRFRGRPFDTPPVQAADYFLRRETGLLTLDGLRFQSAVALGDNTWRVRFILDQAGKTYGASIDLSVSMIDALVSCNSPSIKKVPRYQLLNKEIVPVVPTALDTLA